jgi:hypothetical protein
MALLLLKKTALSNIQPSFCFQHDSRQEPRNLTNFLVYTYCLCPYKVFFTAEMIFPAGGSGRGDWQDNNFPVAIRRFRFYNDMAD